MKFSINSGMLSGALNTLSKSLNSKPTIEILRNFKLTLEGNSLTIVAADGEITSSITLQVNRALDFGDGNGMKTCCINAKRFADLTKNFGSREINVVVEDNVMNIVTASGSFSLPVISSELFPETKFEQNKTFSIPTEILLNGVNSTCNAVSTDKFRPTLQGILLDLKGDKIVFVGTDTRELVKYSHDYEMGIEQKVILPVRAANLICRMFSKHPEVEVEISSNAIRVSTEDATLVAQLINGVYPDYNRVIPTNVAHEIKFDSKEFVSALNLVSSLVDKTRHLVCVATDDAGLTISSKDEAMLTAANERVSAEYDSPLRMGFNSLLLGELINLMGQEKVTMGYNDNDRPAIFVKQEENSELCAILMPMSIVE